MTFDSTRVLLWSPRILGLLVSLFFAFFALDAFGSDRPAPQALADFFIHLIPALVVFALVVLAFRRPRVAGAAFIGLALVYAVGSHDRVDWMLTIAGPLAILGLLFFWSGHSQRGAQMS